MNISCSISGHNEVELYLITSDTSWMNVPLYSKRIFVKLREVLKIKRKITKNIKNAKNIQKSWIRFKVLVLLRKSCTSFPTKSAISVHYKERKQVRILAFLVLFQILKNVLIFIHWKIILCEIKIAPLSDRDRKRDRKSVRKTEKTLIIVSASKTVPDAEC